VIRLKVALANQRTLLGIKRRSTWRKAPSAMPFTSLSGRRFTRCHQGFSGGWRAYIRALSSGEPNKEAKFAASFKG